MDISLITGNAMLILCGLILLYNVFVAFCRGTRKTVIRLTTVAIAAVGAFFVARIGAEQFVQLMLTMLQDALPSEPAMVDLLASDGSAGAAVVVMVQMLSAPLLFLSAYILLKLILIIPYWIAALITRPKKVPVEKKKKEKEKADEAKDAYGAFDSYGVVEEKKKDNKIKMCRPKPKFRSRLFAMLLGAVIGVVGVFVLVVPIFGYIDLAAVVMESDASGDLLPAELAEYEEDYVKPARNTPVVAQTYDAVGAKVFDTLASAKWSDKQVVLREEIDVFVDIAKNAGALSGKDPEAYGEEETAAMEALAEDIGKSPILSSLCAGLLNNAASEWNSGKTFMDMEKPDMGEYGNDILNGFLVVLETSTEENVGDDMTFFAELFSLMVEKEMLSDFGGDDFATHMQNSGFLVDVRALIKAHPRMEPVNQAILDIGMRAMIKEMGLPENYRETHGELMDNMAESLRETPVKEDGSIDETALADKLEADFVSNDIEVSDAAVQLIAEGIAQNFTAEELETLTADDIIDKLIDRFGSVENAVESVS